MTQRSTPGQTRNFVTLLAYPSQRLGCTLFEIHRLVADLFVFGSIRFPNETDRGELRFDFGKFKPLEIGNAANKNGEGIGFVMGEEAFDVSIFRRFVSALNPPPGRDADERKLLYVRVAEAVVPRDRVRNIRGPRSFCETKADRERAKDKE